MTSPLIQLVEISLDLHSHSILQNVTLSVNPNEIVTLIGPNGSGKSSVVKVATGLLEPSSGQVIKRDHLRIGYMPQHLRFDASLPITAHGFLKLASRDQKQIDHWMERLDIRLIRHSLLQHLSGGELQRVLLARALLRRPELLVLDEPTQGVDINGQAELYRIISELSDELDCGVLMVSHDLHLVMARTDTVICLNKHICCYGAPESVSQHPEYLQLFGKEAAKNLAIYTHHHDHEHDVHGNIVEDHTSCGGHDHA